MIETRYDAENALLVASAAGEVTEADYTQRLIPAIEAASANGPLRMLYAFGPEFESFSPGAMWQDTRVGLLHMSDIARVAVVTDEHWLSAMVHAFSWAIPVPVRVFGNDAMGAANSWLLEED